MKLDNYAELYDAYYYAYGCGRKYERDEWWLNLFDAIAQKIISLFQPTSVLDAGCGMGFLVEALRNRGVEAYGVDISEYAIQNVHESIREYCWVSSVTDPFPQKYDLIVSIEVLEHMPRADSEKAVENFCQYANQVLFSSSPTDYKEATHFNVQPPEYWAGLFARHGFFRDCELDVSFLTAWAVCFRKVQQPIWRLVAGYERQLWHRMQDSNAQREVNLEQRRELLEKNRAIKENQMLISRLNEQISENRELNLKLVQWNAVEDSFGWALLQRLQHLRAWIAPPDGLRDRIVEKLFRGLRTSLRVGLKNTLRRWIWNWTWGWRVLVHKLGLRSIPAYRYQWLEITSVAASPLFTLHQAALDVIVCVHNALTDVQRCLATVLQYTTSPYSLILVDDGSDQETQDYLAELARNHPHIILLRNETARGYTYAANQGLRQSTADFVILLNSDTLVVPEWADRMIACAETVPNIGIVGPLSNTASWQSIPEILVDDDWAVNALPEGVTVEQMGRWVAQDSARLYPTMPLLNGFCLLLRRQLIQQIGYFDEETFGAGYGEEDDYCLRARAAGWRLALADDVYIYHAQSRSYSTEKRKQLTRRAITALHQKHGQALIQQSVEACRNARVLQGIRACSRLIVERQAWLERGATRFKGKRVLFVLPVAQAGGGANVIVTEAWAMQAMGVDVEFFNRVENREGFEHFYANFGIRVVYGTPETLLSLAPAYDAVIATVNFTVAWLAPILRPMGYPVRGYYIQGPEPYIYEPWSEDFHTALNSYRLFPDLVRFAKTEWTRQEVQKLAGADSVVVGPSVDLGLFRPRPRLATDASTRPVRIVAMVRPDTPYRQPHLTMQVLSRAYQTYKDDIEVVIFGADSGDARFAALPRSFSWKLVGLIGPGEVATLMNEADIFVDFSSWQSMGLTAMEAMACGVAVIVPQTGGAVEFVTNGVNGLVVDTTSEEACWAAVKLLVEDHQLRLQIQQQALVDVCQYYPEKSAFKILDALFAETFQAEAKV